MKQTTKEHEIKINRVIIYYVLLAMYTHTHTRKFSMSETTWPTAATVNGRDYASTDTQNERQIFIKRFPVHAMWAQTGAEVQLHSFLRWHYMKVSGHVHVPPALKPETNPVTHSTEGWVGPRHYPDILDKIQNPDHPARRAVAVSTAIFQLLHKYSRLVQSFFSL